MISVNPQS